MQTAIPRSINLSSSVIAEYRNELRECQDVIEKAKKQRVSYKDYVGSTALRQAREDAKFLRTAIRRHEKAERGESIFTNPNPELVRLVRLINRLSQSLTHKQIGEIAGCSDTAISNLIHHRNAKLTPFMKRNVKRYTKNLLEYLNRN